MTFKKKKSFMPCTCVHCRLQQNSNSDSPDNCKYKDRHKTKVVTISYNRTIDDNGGGHGEVNNEVTVTNNE